MPQALLVQLRLETFGLPCGPQVIEPPPVTATNPNPLHTILTIANGTTATVTAPANASFAFIGFDDTNTLPLLLGGAVADLAISIGPTGWNALTLPKLVTTLPLTLQNAGAAPVTVEVYIC